MFRQAVQSAYNYLLRPHLPRKIGSFNGVPVRQPRLLDQTDVRPEYEAPLILGIEEQVRFGDEVVIVGRGHGVSATYAARNVKSEGNVIVFEGAKKQIERVRETALLSRTSEITDVRHAIVGPAKNVYGSDNAATEIPSSELPDCDVLVLDCEGAEASIIRKMKTDPRAIVVEAHQVYGAPAEQIRSLLGKRGYSVVSERIEDSPYGDLPVLTATKT